MTMRAMCTLFCLLIVIAGCSHPDPGISEERAKALVGGLGFQDIKLSLEPDDWLVTGDSGPNTYRIKARVTKNGEIKDLSPDEAANQDSVPSSTP